MSRFDRRSLCAHEEGHRGVEFGDCPQDGHGRETSPHCTWLEKAFQRIRATPPEHDPERFQRRFDGAFDAVNRIRPGHPVSLVAIRQRMHLPPAGFRKSLAWLTGYEFLRAPDLTTLSERECCPTDAEHYFTRVVRQEASHDDLTAIAERVAAELFDPDGWPSCESWDDWDHHPANGERFVVTEEPGGLRHRQPLTATVARCPSCGYRVQLPCVACEVRGILTRTGPLPPAPEVQDDPPAVDPNWAWPCNEILLDEPEGDAEEVGA